MVGQIGSCSGSMPSIADRCAPRRDVGPCARTSPKASDEIEHLEYRSAEMRRVDGDTFTYARFASLTYTRTSIALPAPVATAPDGEEATPQTPVPEEPADAPAASPTTVVAFRHVLLNATSVAYWRASGSAASPSANDDAEVQTPAATEVDNADTPPASMVDDAIRRVSAGDFDMLRAGAHERSVEVAMSLELRTAEGDVVKLDFRQLDVLTRFSARGVTADGADVRVRARDAQTQRIVDMSIDGELSDEEQHAIDDLLGAVIEVANKFFRGDVGAAWARLQALEFSPEQLAEVSLRLSSTYRREAVRMRDGDDEAVRALATRDSGVANTLSMLADDQRTLIEAARARFDDRSAVKLVKELLPQLLEAPAAEASPATDVAPSVTTIV